MLCCYYLPNTCAPDFSGELMYVSVANYYTSFKSTKDSSMKKSFYTITIILLSFFSGTIFAQENISDQGQRYVADEVIVKFKPWSIDLQKNSGIKSMQNFAANQELSSENSIPAQNISVMKIEDGQSVAEVIQDLQNDPSIEYVQPNFVYTLAISDPDDPWFPLQWGLKNALTGKDIGRNMAMDIWSGNADQNTTGTIVAVIDNGVHRAHTDLVQQMRDGSNCLSYTGMMIWWCLGWASFFASNFALDPTPLSSENHGTHIAGIIAAQMGNSTGIVGVNPWAKVMWIRVDLTTIEIIKAISFATYNGARVINASRWGTWLTCESVRDTSLYEAIRDFPWLFVTAAWNANKQHLSGWFMIPADFGRDTECRSGLSNIISVMATTSGDVRSSFSDFGTGIDISAPGSSIYSAIEGWYAYADGTSMATPFVAGVASLARSMRPELSYLDIKQAVLDQAEFVLALSWFVQSGRRLNAYNTLYQLIVQPNWSLSFLSWEKTLTTGTYVHLTSSKTGSYLLSWIGLENFLTWDIFLSWIDVFVTLTSNTGQKHIEATFFDVFGKESQVYTASILLDFDPPVPPILISPISWQYVSGMIHFSWEDATDPSWVSGYYMEISSDSGMNTFVWTGINSTSGYSISLFTWETAYYRRVKTLDHRGQYSAFSTTGDFFLLWDSIPDAFSFTGISNVELSTEYTSSPMTVQWITTGSVISIIWGTYQLNNEGSFVSASGVVYSGTTVKVKLNSSSTYSSSSSAILTIWSVTWSFAVQTKANPGWGNPWWGNETIIIPACTTSHLVCVGWVYAKKSGVNCIWGSLWMSCVVTQTWVQNQTGIVSWSNQKYQLLDIVPSPRFSLELNEAYTFARQVGITTMSTIEQANMTGKIIRQHLAKMITNFAIQELEKRPNTGMICDFGDMTSSTKEMQLYSKLACQLWLMWLKNDGTPNQNFFPNKEVTRAQFGTIVSRALWGTTYQNANEKEYYADHLRALNKVGIMKKINNPLDLEIRGYVMLMLMRTMTILPNE